MASYIFYKIPFPISKHQKHHRQTTIIRSQRFHDEGNNRNGVDANMVILSKRIEVERMKEILNKTISISGWNYKSAGYVEKSKLGRGLLPEFYEVACLVGSSFILVFLSGAFFIYLFSLLIKP